MLLCDSYQLPEITLPVPVREWAEHQTTFAMLEEQKFALVQSLASLAHWMGIRAAIQSTVITSPEQRDTCKCQAVTTVREPFSPQFPFRKGSNQWRVSPSQCWKLSQLEFGRHLWPCVWKSFSFDAAVWQDSRNPIATSYQESRCLFRFENERSIKQLLPCWKNEHLLSFNVLPVLPIEWAFVQQSSPQ